MILKKQYLDEKSSGASQVNAASLLAAATATPSTAGTATATQGPTYVQRVIAPSAYPAVMGAPAVPGSASSALNVKPGAAVMPPPPLAAALTQPAKASSLSGQAWYSQTAGRAVNQVKCLLQTLWTAS